MKKIIAAALAALSLVAPIHHKKFTVSGEELASSKSAYLCDFESGTVAYAKEENKRLPIASMCKIMTLLLSFEAVESGNLSFDELVPVSEHAAGMGGSQVFLGANLSYPAVELMKSIAVCSANDSCVALAERIAGDEAVFIEKMNARAKELGAENTLFSNCTGLPKEPQYSSAKDVSLMLRALLAHEKYFEFSKIWLEDFHHPDGRVTSMTNTNKLIRSFEGCDGGKTGFTNEAGFCLAATAKRGDMRLVSVVIGAGDSAARFESTKRMLSFAFANFESRKILTPEKPLENKLPVRGSKTKEICLQCERPLCVFIKRGEKADCNVDIKTIPFALAPVKKGCEVGEAVLFLGGVEKSRCKILAGEDADKYTYLEALQEIAHNW